MIFLPFSQINLSIQSCLILSLDATNSIHSNDAVALGAQIVAPVPDYDTTSPCHLPEDTSPNSRRIPSTALGAAPIDPSATPRPRSRHGPRAQHSASFRVPNQHKTQPPPTKQTPTESLSAVAGNDHTSMKRDNRQEHKASHRSIVTPAARKGNVLGSTTLMAINVSSGDEDNASADDRPWSSRDPRPTSSHDTTDASTHAKGFTSQHRHTNNQQRSYVQFTNFDGCIRGRPSARLRRFGTKTSRLPAQEEDDDSFGPRPSAAKISRLPVKEEDDDSFGPRPSAAKTSRLPNNKTDRHPSRRLASAKRPRMPSEDEDQDDLSRSLRPSAAGAARVPERRPLANTSHSSDDKEEEYNLPRTRRPGLRQGADHPEAQLEFSGKPLNLLNIGDQKASDLATVAHAVPPDGVFRFSCSLPSCPQHFAPGCT